MRNIVTLGLILFLSINSFGQKLSLTDLQSISNKTNWEYVNQYLMNKGWEYYDSEKGNSTKYSTITWSYNKSSYNDEANAWFYLYTYEGLPNKISYSVFNKPSYTIIQNSLSAKGYKLTGSKIEDNEIISTYTNSKFILEITTEKRDKKEEYTYRNESVTAYGFLLIKKSGVYDPDNGKKTDYYYGDVKQSEYSLKNGKLNGKLISYYSNGNTKKTGTYLNGEESGAFKEYSENGKLEFEYSMRSGEFEGGFKAYFDNGQLKKSGSFINGKKTENL
jgi:antitoxin component YwqK of YwqJK toxin-antitoxin module